MNTPARWILLRGLTRDARHWGDFPARLGAALAPAEVHTPDLPGNGRLHLSASPLDVTAMAEDCRAQLRAAGVAPPYRLFALSLGAMAAVAWATRHPEEIEACVLVNTSLRPFARLHERLRPACYPRLLRLAVLGATPARWEEAVFNITSRSPHDADLLADWTRWRLERPVSRANALRQLIAAARFRAPRAAPSLPMLVLSSARDGLVDPVCSARLAQAWGLPHVQHPTAGHDLPLDDPAWVIERLQAWMAQCAPLMRT